MTTGQTWGYYFPISQSTRFTLPCVVEMDIVAYTDSPRLRWQVDSTTTVNVGNISVTGHWKYILSNTSCTLSINDGTPLHLTALENATKTNGIQPFWELDADIDSVTYKNFIIYSI